MLCDVTFRCGHTRMVNLTGQQEDRQRKLLRYNNFVICPDCQSVRVPSHSKPAASVWADVERLRSHY